MYLRRAGKNRVYLILIAALALLSMSCGLINRAMEAATDFGMDALRESDVGDQVFSVIDMIEGESVDLTEYEIPGLEFLFEVDPFDDVIRWRFYAISAEVEDIATRYVNRLPDYLVETDQEIDGYRYLVLTAGHRLSGIYDRDQMLGFEQPMQSALLDVEVLNATAHRNLGRLAASEAMGRLPGPVPEDVTLVIFVYNLSGLGIEDILEMVPGVIPGLDEDGMPLDPRDQVGEDDDDDARDADDPFREDDDFADFMDDDEDRQIEDMGGLCTQVQGSGDCYHPYLPVVEGFSRSYQTEEGVITETVTDVGPDGFTVVTQTADGQTVSVDFDCTPEGVAGWNFDDSLMATMDDVPADLAVDIEIDGVQLPTEFAVGDTWSVSVTATIGVQAAGAESKNVVQIEMNYTAVGEETITTPAGRFTAMRVDYVSSGDNTLVVTGPAGTFSQNIFTLDGSGSEWYVECLGKVRSVAYSNWTGIATVQSETRMEMSDFGFQ